MTWKIKKKRKRKRKRIFKITNRMMKADKINSQNNLSNMLLRKN